MRNFNTFFAISVPAIVVPPAAAIPFPTALKIREAPNVKNAAIAPPIAKPVPTVENDAPANFAIFFVYCQQVLSVKLECSNSHVSIFYLNSNKLP